MTGPTRASVAGRAYLDLRNKARRERRPTQTFHIDVSVGDPVWPAPEMIELPCLLEGSVQQRGYPAEAVLAEKIVTAGQRGTVNTRWRDFADIYLLRARQMSTAPH